LFVGGQLEHEGDARRRRSDMKKFVYWTGVYNIVLGLGFLLPPLVDFLQVSAPESGFWVRLPAIMVIFLGILLVICSRDLRARASIVYWEGILRIVLALLLVGYGFFGGIGVAMAIVGIVDLLIGLVYVIGLPQSLQVKHAELLADNL
jgi:hypothetical protein